MSSMSQWEKEKKKFEEDAQGKFMTVGKIARGFYKGMIVFYANDRSGPYWSTGGAGISGIKLSDTPKKALSIRSEKMRSQVSHIYAMEFESEKEILALVGQGISHGR